MSNANRLYQSLNLRTMIAILKQDPSCLEDIQAGLADAETPATSPLGSIQVGDEWYTVFAGTNREKKVGEPGVVYRTKPRPDGKGGDRIKLNLVRQNKEHFAQAEGATAAPAPTVTAGMITPELLAQLQTLMGQQAVAGYTAPKAEAPKSFVKDEEVF